MFRIINIVDSVSELNYGIWNAAIVNSGLLKRHNISVELWHPDPLLSSIENATSVRLSGTSLGNLKQLIKERRLNPKEDTIITHGVWHYTSKWGSYLRSKGFNWVIVPQGMLEPWPLQQKWLKKKLYFNLVERRLITRADIIRAVSKSEAVNLSKMFPLNRIEFIPNGVKVHSYNENRTVEARKITKYLFLSRLHHKKNILALTHAWIESKLNNDPGFRLLIAGPDQGELEKILPVIAATTNIEYVGPVFGSDKEALFSESTFYVLPSFSEGLPSSLLEAMASGLIPIISEGCNLPEVFDRQLGVIISTNKTNIKEKLEYTSEWTLDRIREKADLCKAFIRSEYSIEAITKKQIELYNKRLYN
jgi:glycosyltransferase involved in cell wall biosynthesis